MQRSPAGDPKPMSGHTSEAAILVSIDFGENDHSESLEELRLLAETAGVRTVAIVEAKRQRPDAALFAGSGKVQEIAELAERMEVPLIIFNHDLSPGANAQSDCQAEYSSNRPDHVDSGYFCATRTKP